MISEASDRLQVALEACLDGDILTSFEGFCTTACHCGSNPQWSVKSGKSGFWRKIIFFHFFGAKKVIFIGF